jgi:plastocyanin
MNKTRVLISAAGIAFILTMIFLIGNPPTTGAAERCDIVTIRGRDNIEPTMLTVQKGDCVVWMNWTREQDVLLSFKEGEKCVRATKTPVGFKMDVPTGCYLAGWLSYGQTSSLVFTETGTYDYEVQFKVGGSNRGAIIVK